MRTGQASRGGYAASRSPRLATTARRRPRPRRSRAPATRAGATGRGGSGCGSTRLPAPTSPRQRGDHAHGQHRQREHAGRGAVEDGVRADAQAAQPGQHQRAGRAAAAGRQPAGAAVAAGVHAGGQGERALEGVLEDRDDQAPQPADAPGVAAAQPLRGADPPQAVGQLRQDRDGDDEGGADLVERGRHRAQQPLGVGQAVGRADADHDRPEPEPVVQREQQRLAGHRPEEVDAERPAGQRDLGQVEQHQAEVAATEEDPEQHADDDDHRGQQRRRCGTSRDQGWSPRRAATTRAATPMTSSSSQRFVVQRGDDRQADRPAPPRDRVEVARQPGQPRSQPCRVHECLRRATATAPAAPRRTTTRTGATQTGRPPSSLDDAGSTGSSTTAPASVCSSVGGSEVGAVGASCVSEGDGVVVGLGFLVRLGSTRRLGGGRRARVVGVAVGRRRGRRGGCGRRLLGRRRRRRGGGRRVRRRVGLGPDGARGAVPDHGDVPARRDGQGAGAERGVAPLPVFPSDHHRPQ